ncbi:hypothetical protein ACT80S_17445, partial [Ramlibacter sp. MAHUQ-53]
MERLEIRRGQRLGAAGWRVLLTLLILTLLTLLAACGGEGGLPGGGGNGSRTDPVPAITADPANAALPRIEPYEHGAPQSTQFPQSAALRDLTAPESPAAVAAAARVDLGPLPAAQARAVEAGRAAPADPRKARPIGLTRASAATADA